MLRKMMIRIIICMLLAFVIWIAYNSENEKISGSAENVLEQLSVSYTAEEIREAAEGLHKNFLDIVGRTSDAVNVFTGKSIYGEPIDEKYEGEETPVYSIGGGKVVSVGENEEIGKYVKIVHGDQAESLYGNLDTVEVTVPANVKKGQIIGVYNKLNGKDFYYSFQEF